MGDNTDLLIPQMELWTPPVSNPCQMTFNQFQPADLVRSQTSHTTGSFFYEMVFNVATSIAQVGVGIDNNFESLILAAGRAGSICWQGDGTVNYNGSFGVYSASSFSVGDVLGVDTDLTGKTIRFRVNGGSFTTAFSIAAIVTGSMFALAQLKNQSDQVTANFTGVSPAFAFTAPSTAWG